MTPADVSDDVHQRLRDRFTEKQIVELSHNIAWENARARFNRGFRIDPDGYTAG